MTPLPSLKKAATMDSCSDHSPSGILSKASQLLSNRKSQSRHSKSPSSTRSSSPSSSALKYSKPMRSKTSIASIGSSSSLGSHSLSPNPSTSQEFSSENLYAHAAQSITSNMDSMDQASIRSKRSVKSISNSNLDTSISNDSSGEGPNGLDQAPAELDSKSIHAPALQQIPSSPISPTNVTNRSSTAALDEVTSQPPFLNTSSHYIDSRESSITAVPSQTRKPSEDSNQSYSSRLSNFRQFLRTNSSSDSPASELWESFYQFTRNSKNSDSLVYAVTRKEAITQFKRINSDKEYDIIELWTMMALRFVMKG